MLNGSIEGLGLALCAGLVGAFGCAAGGIEVPETAGDGDPDETSGTGVERARQALTRGEGTYAVVVHVAVSAYDAPDGAELYWESDGPTGDVKTFESGPREIAAVKLFDTREEASAFDGKVALRIGDVVTHQVVSYDDCRLVEEIGFASETYPIALFNTSIDRVDEDEFRWSGAVFEGESDATCVPLEEERPGGVLLISEVTLPRVPVRFAIDGKAVRPRTIGARGHTEAIQYELFTYHARPEDEVGTLSIALDGAEPLHAAIGFADCNHVSPLPRDLSSQKKKLFLANGQLEKYGGFDCQYADGHFLSVNP